VTIDKNVNTVKRTLWLHQIHETCVTIDSPVSKFLKSPVSLQVKQKASQPIESTQCSCTW